MVVLRGPENTDGYDHWWGYVLACDDPALCKAPYIAAKNVYYPEQIRKLHQLNITLKILSGVDCREQIRKDPIPMEYMVLQTGW